MSTETLVHFVRLHRIRQIFMVRQEKDNRPRDADARETQARVAAQGPFVSTQHLDDDFPITAPLRKAEGFSRETAADASTVLGDEHSALGAQLGEKRALVVYRERAVEQHELFFAYHMVHDRRDAYCVVHCGLPNDHGTHFRSRRREGQKCRRQGLGTVSKSIGTSLISSRTQSTIAFDRRARPGSTTMKPFDRRAPN